jgi:hypothetical protein
MHIPKHLVRVASLGAVLVAAMCLTVGAEETAYTKKTLQDFYVAYLQKEGFRPEIDDDGNVRFKREGKNFVINIEEQDPSFLKIDTAVVSTDKTPETFRKRLAAANHANNKTKVAKVVAFDDGAIFSIEMWLPKPEDTTAGFERLLNALDYAVDLYRKKFNE